MQLKTTITYFLTILTLVGITSLSYNYAFAQTVTTSPNQTTRLNTLKITCDTQANNRTSALNTASSRISSAQKLSDTQKAQFNSAISADSTCVANIKAKCDSDTDLATLRTDYRSLFTSCRIYAVALPQMRLEAAADTMDITADTLNNLAGILQTRIQTGGNPANLVSLLTDMQTQIKNAQSQYSQVISQISGLTPSSYNTNPAGTRNIEMNARNEIQTGATDLKAAWQDAKNIRDEIKSLSQTPTPSS